MDPLVNARCDLATVAHDEPICDFGGRRVGSKFKSLLCGKSCLTFGSKSLKNRVFEALSCESIEMNAHGEVALHGLTLSAWTTAIPGTF